MINNHPALSWGKELDSSEMQNIKGGDWLIAGIAAVIVDFLYHLYNDGGDVEQACKDTGTDISAVMGLIQATIGWQLEN